MFSQLVTKCQENAGSVTVMADLKQKKNTEVFSFYYRAEINQLRTNSTVPFASDLTRANDSTR